MAGHDPCAADALTKWLLAEGNVWCSGCKGYSRPDRDDAAGFTADALDVLDAAGLVVRPADEYERAMQDGAQLYLTRDGMATTIPAHSTDRPLYVRKENPDD